MVKKRITVTNELGLHARPAAMIAKLAQQAKAGIYLEKEDYRVDASSIIDILTLACFRGTKLTITAEDTEDIKIFDKIIQLFKNDFGE